MVQVEVSILLWQIDSEEVNQLFESGGGLRDSLGHSVCLHVSVTLRLLVVVVVHGEGSKAVRSQLSSSSIVTSSLLISVMLLARTLRPRGWYPPENKHGHPQFTS